MRDISVGICRWEGFKDAERLYAVSGCGDPKSSHDIFVYVEQVAPYVIVSVQTEVHASDFGCKNWFTKAVWRLYAAARILIKGKISTSSEFYFIDQQAALDYADAIKQSIERVSLEVD
jgi:hypothetical protein